MFPYPRQRAFSRTLFNRIPRKQRGGYEIIFTHYSNITQLYQETEKKHKIFKQMGL